MAIELDTKLDYPLQTAAGARRMIGRDYKALLRSTGHLFRDGRWLGTEDPFHVYRELENPGLGALQTYLGPSGYLKGFDPAFPQFDDLTAIPWRPALGRAYEFDYWNEHEEVLPPKPVDPLFEDHVLGLNFKGTDFIRRFRPGNPLGQFGQFVVELRQLPRLPIFLQQRAKRFRDLGSEYLNVEFGWKPFLREVLNVGHTQLRIHAELNKLIKNNGIRVKRRSKRETVVTGDDVLNFATYSNPFTFLGDQSMFGIDEACEFYTFGPYNSGADSNITGECRLSWQHFTEVVTWYVGTYYYYVPDIGSSRWTHKAKAILSGIAITPDLLYQVYPWTWLADWFANVGDILSNLTSNAVDSEALSNSFIMETTTDSLRIDADVLWNDHERFVDGSPSHTFVSSGAERLSYSLIKKEKVRAQASPFGFGLSSESFSARQKAILAALFFSRRVPTTRSFGI